MLKNKNSPTSCELKTKNFSYFMFKENNADNLENEGASKKINTTSLFCMTESGTCWWADFSYLSIRAIKAGQPSDLPSILN